MSSKPKAVIPKDVIQKYTNEFEANYGITCKVEKKSNLTLGNNGLACANTNNTLAE